MTPILKAQLCVLERMVTQAEQKAGNGDRAMPPVVIVMEMFNFEQQSLLDAYQADELPLKELENRYQGTEGFLIQGHYGYLLEAAKELGVKLVAGFAPKHLCTAIIKEGKNSTLERIEQLGGPTSEFYIDGSEEHYNYFQGLISGDMDKVVDNYRRIFPAQVLRDSVFARTVMDLTNTHKESRILGICGSGHLDFKFGIPERISTEVPVYIVTSRAVDDTLEKNVADSIFQYKFE